MKRLDAANPADALEPLTSIEELPTARRRSRRPTSTARFGSSRREAHDASAFYDRFTAPELSSDEELRRTAKVDVIYRTDARKMARVASNSVALVVTSPPYFAGKQYEEVLGQGGVPGSYFEYLNLLREVFDECKRVLEPGGRIAVNVANLGRRPYRSLAGDVTQLLESLGLLMRGEVVWWKGKAAGSSCAWGTFQRPGNPVLRDVTERVVIASKGRFDRALSPQRRHALGYPSTATITREEFLEATTDLWEIPPESATRVGHPAPFPVGLPQRLMELYTYEDDLVLDPFMGSGTTAVAAVRTGRHFVGFDTDAEYVARARARVDEERARLEDDSRAEPSRVVLPAIPTNDESSELRVRAVREGRKAKELAAVLLQTSGFEDIRADVRMRDLGIEIDFLARDRKGRDWAFDVSGSFTTGRGGLRKAETLWKVLGKAAVFDSPARGVPLVLLTTEVPVKGSPGNTSLSSLLGPARPVFDVIELLAPDDEARLVQYAKKGHLSA